MICVSLLTAPTSPPNGNDTLIPLSAEMTETLNSEFELTRVHPIDEAVKRKRLVEGCIFCTLVPLPWHPHKLHCAR